MSVQMFNPGDRVRIRDGVTNYEITVPGSEGEVVDTSRFYILVEFDLPIGESFWVDGEHLELIDDNEFMLWKPM